MVLFALFSLVRRLGLCKPRILLLRSSGFGIFVGFMIGLGWGVSWDWIRAFLNLHFLFLGCFGCI